MSNSASSAQTSSSLSTPPASTLSSAPGAPPNEDNTRYFPRTKSEWLDSILISASRPGSMTIQQFLNTTNHTSTEYSFWQDSQFEWALELLRQKYKAQQDIEIATTWISTCCFQVYVQCKDKKRFASRLKSLRKDYENEIASLKGKEIIVLPVNDGIGNADFDEDLGNGNHWSFIIISMKNQSASYVDGLVVPGVKSSKRTKDSISINEPKASNIIQGFNKLLGNKLEQDLEKQILTWIPGMRDNLNKEDGGSCGAFSFAFLDFVLENRQLIDDGLENTFDRKYHKKRGTGKRKRQADDFTFDSVHERKRVRDLLWKERLRQEQHKEYLYPANITPALLKRLICPEFVELIAGSDETNFSPKPKLAGTDKETAATAGPKTKRATRIHSIVPRLFIDLTPAQLDMWKANHPHLDTSSPALFAAHLQQLYSVRFGNMTDEDIQAWKKKDNYGREGGSMEEMTTAAAREFLIQEYDEIEASDETNLFPDLQEYRSCSSAK